MSKKLFAGFLVSFAMGALTAEALGPLHIFNSGQVIRAAEINENFEVLRTGLQNVDAATLGGQPASAFLKATSPIVSSGVITAAGFAGSGSGLTGVPWSSITGKPPLVSPGDEIQTSHVECSGTVKVGGDFSSSANFSNRGSIRFNTLNNKLEFSDGTSWRQIQSF